MKKKIFLLIALVLCMALMIGVLAACNEGGTTGTGGDDTQGGVTPGGDDEQGGNTPGGDDENQGGNTPGGWDPDDFPWGSGDNDDDDDTPGGDFPWNPGGDDDDDTPGDTPGGDFPWNPGGDDDDDTPGGDFPWNPGGDDDEPVIPVPGGDGDVIFTEDASLAEIIAALENAEKFTCELSGIYTTVSDGAIVSERNNIVQVSENAMYSVTETKSDGPIGRYDYAIFTEGGVAFRIGTSGTEVDEREKDLLSNIDPLALAEPHIDPLYYLLTEENGKIVLNPEVTTYYTDLYLRLEGDRLVIGGAYIFDNQKATYEYVWSKVNATDVVIPEELKALVYDADWADYVDYNGVSYQKAEDEYGEYYYVSSVQEGAVPEETINTLPVREEGEAPAVSEGDVIFTEDASLAEILAALENAESFTCEANGINSTVSDGAIVFEANNIVQVSENAIYIISTTKSDGEIGVYEGAAFTDEGVVYKITDDGTEMSKEKNLVSNFDPIADEYIFILSDFLTEENGKIVIDPEVAEGEYDIYLRLEGDRLVIGLSRIYNNEKETIEYVWSKVNATDVVIPEEVKALAYDADWADYVHYNGVSYQKAEDATGEYYYVSSVQEGASPEETINGLPVR